MPIRLQFTETGLYGNRCIECMAAASKATMFVFLFPVAEGRCGACVLWHPANRNPPPGQLPWSHWELGEVAGGVQHSIVQHRWPPFHHCPPGPRPPPAEHTGHDCCSSCLWHKPREKYPFPAVSGQLLRPEPRGLGFLCCLTCLFTIFF